MALSRPPSVAVLERAGAALARSRAWLAPARTLLSALGVPKCLTAPQGLLGVAERAIIDAFSVNCRV